MADIIEDFDSSTGNIRKKNKINPLWIHLGFLLLLLLIIIMVFFADFSLFNKEEEKPVMKLIGKQDNFSIPFQGDLIVETKSFLLNTNSGTYEGNSQNFEISNFSGNIDLVNSNIIFSGNAQNITFGQNRLQLDNSYFVLNSSRKTSLSFYLDSLSMNFSDGDFKFDDRLSYDFENASVNFIGANTTMVYDGVFAFTGHIKQFDISTSNNIDISYVEPVLVE